MICYLGWRALHGLYRFIKDSFVLLRLVNAGKAEVFAGESERSR